MNNNKKKYFNLSEKQSFYNSLYVLVKSQSPIIDSFLHIAKFSSNDKIRNISQQIYLKLKSGSLFSKAIQPFEEYIGIFEANMIIAGEDVGKLQDILFRINAIINKQIELKGKIISALTYPFILLGLTFIIGLLYFFVILPALKSIGTGDIVEPKQLLISGGIKIFIVVFVFIFLLSKIMKNEDFKNNLKKKFVSLPLINKIYRNFNLSNFLMSFLSAYNAGVPIIKVFEISGAVFPKFSQERKHIKQAVALIDDGKTFSDALIISEIIPPQYNLEIASGCETGNIDETFSSIIKSIDEDIEVKLKALCHFIEPAMLIIIGIMVCCIVVSFYSNYINSLMSIY